MNKPGPLSGHKRYINQNEYMDVLKNVQNTRDLLILRLGYECGLRCSEIARLRITDVHDNYIEIVDSKFGKHRVIPLNNNLNVVLHEWIESQKYVWGALLKSNKRKTRINMIRTCYGKIYTSDMLSPRTIQQIVKDAFERIGIYATPTDLRRSYVSNHIDIPQINNLKSNLGHVSLKSTEIYMV